MIFHCNQIVDQFLKKGDYMNLRIVFVFVIGALVTLISNSLFPTPEATRHLYVADFEHGIILTTPGYYLMVNDVAFSSTISTTALTIDSDHVTVDLNGKALYQDSAEADNVGIYITDNKHNIIVQNGSVVDFSLNDILMGQRCYHVAIEKLQIVGGGTPLYGAGNSGSEIYDCYISNCVITTGTECGLHLNYCDDMEISGCNFVRNYNYGAYLTNCIGCQFSDCGFDHTIGTMASYGLCAESPENLLLNACTFNSNTATTTCAGMYLLSSTGSIIKQCVINCNASSNDNSCYGIRIVNGKGDSVQACSVSSNNSENALCFGINFDNCRGCRVLDSTSVSQTNTSATQEAVGFMLDNGSHNALIDCTAEDVQSGVDDFGIGIKIGSSESSSVVKSCLSFSNTGTGIINDSSTSLVFGCMAGANGISNYGGTQVPNTETIARLGANTATNDFANISLE